MLALPSFSCLSIFLTTHLYIWFYVAGGHDPLKAALNTLGKCCCVSVINVLLLGIKRTLLCPPVCIWNSTQQAAFSLCQGLSVLGSASMEHRGRCGAGGRRWGALSGVLISTGWWVVWLMTGPAGIIAQVGEESLPQPWHMLSGLNLSLIPCVSPGSLFS